MVFGKTREEIVKYFTTSGSRYFHVTVFEGEKRSEEYWTDGSIKTPYGVYVSVRECDDMKASFRQSKRGGRNGRVPENDISRIIKSGADEGFNRKGGQVFLIIDNDRCTTFRASSSVEVRDPPFKKVS